MPQAKPVAATIPGLYAYLTELEQRDHDQADPRLNLVCTSAEWDEACAEARSQPPTGMLAALLAARPVVIPAWKVRGRTFGEAASLVPWLADAREVVVHADDTISAA